MTVFSDENSQSSVCLDGSAIKRIREEKRLTQLYVSKVVGVTTDTVSRWENNRYPTIRRENALKLAEALETPLETLMRSSALTQSTIDAPANKLPYILVGLAIVLVVVFAVIFILVSKSPLPQATVTAQRLLPVHAAPGSTIPIIVELTSRSSGDGFILREFFPKGWTLVQSNPPASSLDNINGVARWIVKAGDQLERIVYLVKVNMEAELDDQQVFQGEIIVGNERSQSSVAVLGSTTVKVAPVHWADSDGDGQVDDVEMLQASYTIEDMAGVHIDWNDLERIWGAGSYRWDDTSGKFLPKPRNLPEGG